LQAEFGVETRRRGFEFDLRTSAREKQNLASSKGLLEALVLNEEPNWTLKHRGPIQERKSPQLELNTRYYLLGSIRSRTLPFCSINSSIHARPKPQLPQVTQLLTRAETWSERRRKKSYGYRLLKKKKGNPPRLFSSLKTESVITFPAPGSFRPQSHFTRTATLRPHYLSTPPNSTSTCRRSTSHILLPPTNIRRSFDTRHTTTHSHSPLFLLFV